MQKQQAISIGVAISRASLRLRAVERRSLDARAKSMRRASCMKKRYAWQNFGTFVLWERITLAWASWMEMSYGEIDRALQTARRVLNRSPSYDARLRVALVLTTAGFTDEAEAVATELATSNPEHTIINSILVPIVRAGVALGRKEREKAIEHLSLVAPYELGFIAALAPIYLRAQSYLMQEARLKRPRSFNVLKITEAQILFHRSTPQRRWAWLRRAVSGNVGESRKAYDRFFAAWMNADRDVPLLIDARNEYQKLSAGVGVSKGIDFQLHPRI